MLIILRECHALLTIQKNTDKAPPAQSSVPMNENFYLGFKIQLPGLLVLSVLGLLLLNSPGNAADTILSKDHAATIFAMNKSEWNNSVLKNKTVQVQKSDLNAEGVARMQLQYGNGALLHVTPEFEISNHNPSRINVTLAMPTPMSLMFDEDTIRKITEQAALEMLPEYNLLGSYENVGGGVALFFVIIEN